MELLQYWAQEQHLIVETILSYPTIALPHLHTPFSPADRNLPSFPLVPHNDETLCCLLGQGTGEGPVCRGDSYPLGSRGKVGVPYLVTLEDGSTLLAKVSLIPELDVNIRDSPPSSLRSLSGREKDASACLGINVPLNSIRYVGSDDFTNETIIAYLINYYRERLSGPPLFVHHYWATVCDEGDSPIGVNVMEYCSLGNLLEFPSRVETYPLMDRYEVNVPQVGRSVMLLMKPEHLLEILKQVLAALLFAQEYLSFGSGDLKTANVLVQDESIDMVHNGVPLQSSFTCKLADFGKSSCTVSEEGRALRFYNHSKWADKYLYFQPFNLNVSREGDKRVFRINPTFIFQEYVRSRHMGIPYYAAFDWYTFIVSFLLQPEYHYSFFADPLLQQLFWEPLWLHRGDGELVRTRIQLLISKGKGRTISDAIGALKHVGMLCSGARDSWRVLQAHYS